MEFEPDLIVPNKNLSLAQGAIMPWVKATGEGFGWYMAILEALASERDFSMNTPVRELPGEVIDLVLHGDRHEEDLRSV